MDTFQKMLTDRLRKKQFTGKAGASLLIQVCKWFALYPHDLQWKLERHILFLRLHPSEDKMKFFLRKQEILQACHDALAKLWSKILLKDLKIIT